MKERAGRLDQEASRRHWDENLDPQNLGAAIEGRDFKREWAFYASDEARFAASRMPDLKGARCLELGAGLGTHVLWLARQGARVIAVDFSLARLKALKEAARSLAIGERIECVQCAAEHLPFLDARMRMVYTKAVLIHTRLPEALSEARRVLDQGGRAIFMEPFACNPFAGFVRWAFAPQEWKAFTRYFDSWSIEQVEKEFPRLEKRPFYLVGFLPFIWQFHWPRLGLFRLSLAMTRWLDGLLFALIPGSRKLAWFWVFVGEKE